MSITSGHELLSPTYYAENGPPYAISDRLRAESPILWCDIEEV